MKLLKDNLTVKCEKAECERIATRLYNWSGAAKKPLLLCDFCGDAATKVVHI